MPMHEDLVARLKADAGIAALLTGANRISWFDRVREAGLPSITLTMVSPGRDWQHDGPDGLDGPRVQFDCWAETRPAAAALARAVRAAMEQSAEVGDTLFHVGFLEGEQWIAEGEQDGGTTLFRVVLDFMFYHEES